MERKYELFYFKMSPWILDPIVTNSERTKQLISFQQLGVSINAGMDQNQESLEK